MVENVLEQCRRLWGLRRRGSADRAGFWKGKMLGEGGVGGLEETHTPLLLSLKGSWVEPWNGTILRESGSFAHEGLLPAGAALASSPSSPGNNFDQRSILRMRNGKTGVGKVHPDTVLWGN